MNLSHSRDWTYTRAEQTYLRAEIKLIPEQRLNLSRAEHEPIPEQSKNQSQSRDWTYPKAEQTYFRAEHEPIPEQNMNLS